MNDETKKQINEQYERELQKGERFWPDSIYKDLLVSLGLFILLVLLATFAGVAPDPKADPSDTAYVPRPEWYFLFLFKFLALYGQIPLLGRIEWIAAILIPGLAVLVLTLIPFIDHSPHRYYGRRVLPISVMTVMVIVMVALTLMSDVSTVSADGSKLLGLLQIMAGLVVPVVAILAMFILTFTLKARSTTPMIWITGLASLLVIGFTASVLGLAPDPVIEEVAVASTLPERILAGQDLYSVNCVECHGDDGKVTVIEGVEGLEGKQISSINSRDVLYTLEDASLHEIIAYGRPDSGMTPFGKAYGGELSKSEIDYIVTFMRYMWDDRFEIPAEALQPLFPPLADGEIPSYDMHIQPIVKRYCISCHRPGKDNNEYLMTSYEELLASGENKGNNIIAGDENSYLLQVIQGHPILDDNEEEIIGVMPPKSTLKPDVIDVWLRWILNDMPRAPEDAAQMTGR
jgi:mono/diheme cytochrome c family protein